MFLDMLVDFEMQENEESIDTFDATFSHALLATHE